MKKHLLRDKRTRRAFLGRAACGAMGITGMVSTLTHLRLMQATLAQQQHNLTDYKSLVVLFLFGGANTDNLLVPRGNHPARPNYDADRGVLGIPESELVNITASNLSGGDEEFGLHPSLTDLAPIFSGGDLAMAANVGTLVEPTQKTGNMQFDAPVPPQLFSHSDQQVQWQTALPDQPFRAGWGGRVSDMLTDKDLNPYGKVSMSVTLSGLNSLLVGLPGSPVQYSVTDSGAVSLRGYGSNYSNALNDPSDIYSYRDTTAGRRLEAFQSIMDYSHANLMEDYYNTVVKRARVNESFVTEAFTEAGSSGVDFDQIFLNQHGVGNTGQLPRVSRQLLTIAKMIAGRDSLGNNRQIFFCSQGGYDTHQNQVDGLAGNYGDLNDALASFYEAMGQLAAADGDFNADDYLLATHSDFNRTFNPNGSYPGSAGSDHAWGGHQLVMGGGVDGGKVYGYYPDLAINGPLDVNSSNGRGRWVPSSSVEQFTAPLARWMGVNINGNGSIGGSEMETVFPNLGRFANPFQSNYDPADPLGNANLDFML